MSFGWRIVSDKHAVGYLLASPLEVWQDVSQVWKACWELKEVAGMHFSVSQVV